MMDQNTDDISVDEVFAGLWSAALTERFIARRKFLPVRFSPYRNVVSKAQTKFWPYVGPAARRAGEQAARIDQREVHVPFEAIAGLVISRDLVFPLPLQARAII